MYCTHLRIHAYLDFQEKPVVNNGELYVSDWSSSLVCLIHGLSEEPLDGIIKWLVLIKKVCLIIHMIYGGKRQKSSKDLNQLAGV